VPAAAPPKPKDRAPRSRATGVAVALAVVATLLALAGVAFGVYEKNRADDLASKAGNPQPVNSKPAATGPVTPPAVGGTVPGGPPLPSPGDIDPGAAFTNSYAEQQQLTLHAPGQCQAQFDVDVDEPRVGVDDNVADLFLSQACGAGQPLSFQFGASTAAIARPSDPGTPSGCAELVRTGALGEGMQVSVAVGVSLCLVTDPRAARQQGISWKIVFIHVNNVAPGGLVTVTISAWNVPE